MKKAISLPANLDNPEKWKTWLALGIILLITCIVYTPVFNNGFVWDDVPYISNNPLIYTINLKKIFSSYLVGNYHPLTILILAIEYKFFGLNTTGYHAFNLFLHLLNVILVFYTVFLLSKKYGVALVASLLFGIHPLHVESVAWASEIKDLLYTFFFLSSYIFYLKYLNGFQKKYFILALIIFLLSLLSKAMAASLPVLFILTDFFKGRKINFKSLLEKVPFFLFAIALGIVAIMAQKSSGAIQDISRFNFSHRIVFACYGFTSYLLELFLPFNLSVFYPYPGLKNGNIPMQYNIYVLLFLGLAVYIFYSLRISRKIFFGIGFFAITVFLVLQLLPVGAAIKADRYSYIPSIGVFFLVGEGLNLLWKRKAKWIAPVLLSAFSIFFSVHTFSRCYIWKTDFSLWDNVLKNYPKTALANNNRGYAYSLQKKNDLALNDYNEAIKLSPKYADAYYNRGIVFMEEKSYEKAIADYSKAIELKPGYANAYLNRGVIFQNTNRYDDALNDFNKAVSLNPGLTAGYFNKGYTYLIKKLYAESILNFSKAIELIPNHTDAFYNRGIAFAAENNLQQAIADFNKVIEISPKHINAYFQRGKLFMNSNKFAEALNDFNKSIEVNPGLTEAYVYRTNILKDHRELNNNTTVIVSTESSNDIKEFYDQMLAGMEAYKLEKYAEAIQHYKKCDMNFEKLGGHSKFPDFLNSWARSHLNLNEIVPAKTLFNRVLNAEPKNYYALMNLGNIAFHNEKKYTEAINYFLKCVEADKPDYFLSYSNIGTLYLIQNNPDKAIEYYEKSLKYGSSPEILGNLFLLWKSKGNQEKMTYYQGLLDKK